MSTISSQSDEPAGLDAHGPVRPTDTADIYPVRSRDKVDQATSQEQTGLFPLGSLDPLDDKADQSPYKSMRHPIVTSFFEKLGRLATSALILCFVVIVACIIALLCLWLLDADNSQWHSLVANNGLNRAVTVVSEVLGQALSLQIDVVAAMIAALILKTSVVCPRYAALTSISRTGVSGFKASSLMGMYWSSSKTFQATRLYAIAAFAGMLLLFVQVTTVILISDIGLRSLPSFVTTKPIHFGFNFFNVSEINSWAPQLRILPHGPTRTTKSCRVL